jgi:hypothetical protein
MTTVIRRHVTWRGTIYDDTKYFTVDGTPTGAPSNITITGADGWHGNDLVVNGGIDPSLPVSDPYVWGSGAADLWGDTGDDTLVGGSAADNLDGGQDDDLLVGGPGDDTLSGATGIDTGVFFGPIGDYHLVALGGGNYQLTDSAPGRDGSDRLNSIEFLEFGGLGGTVYSPAAAIALIGTPYTPVVSAISPDTGVGGDGVTASATVVVSGTSDPHDTITLYDRSRKVGSTTADVTGHWKVANVVLVEGLNSLTAIAKDSAGQVSPKSTPYVAVLDTHPPVAPSIAEYSPDSGLIGDGVTNSPSVSMSGAAEAGSTVTIFDGSIQAGTVTADSSGHWSLANLTLTEGSNSLTATATDIAGNVSAPSAALAVTLDSQAPDPPAVSGISPDTGVSGDGITDSQIVAVSGTAEAGSAVTVFDGSTEVGTTAADGSGNWSLANVLLGEGANSLTATATDPAGNVGDPSAALAVTLDTQVPDAPVISGISPDTGDPGDGITDSQVVAVSGTAEAGSTVTVFDGSVQAGTVTADGSGNWTLGNVTLAEGSNSLTATATDAAGNISAGSSVFDATYDPSEASSSAGAHPDVSGHHPLLLNLDFLA